MLAALTGLAAASGAVGAAIACAELVAEIRRRGRATRERRQEGGQSGLRAVAEAGLRRLGSAVASAGALRGMSPPGDLRQHLAAAGQPAGLELREWLALKAVCAVLAAFAAAFAGTGTPGRIGFLLVAVAPVAGFVAPDLWLARIARRRLEAAVCELPDMLDLLRVTVEAGMPPARALGVVAGEFRGPLAVESRRASAEVALGLPQAQAFAGIGDRLPAEEVKAFVASLARARRHGVPLGRALAVQAAVARDRRCQRVREQAARAGPKIQLVVALVMVPAVLLTVAAGLVAELEHSGLLLPL